MHPALSRNVYLVKQHVGFFKASASFDIIDPASSNKVLECREEKLGFFTKLFRFTEYKRMTPFDVQVRTPEGNPVVRVRRGVTLFTSKVDVLDENDQRVGGFRQKWFSIGAKFDVLGGDDQVLCTLKGKWTSWEFRFMAGENELALVTKKWAGLGKELFTSADNYMLQISEQVPPESPVRQLILAAVMCIDLVLKQ
jgi:uncharacterized protein YxjI